MLHMLFESVAWSAGSQSGITDTSLAMSDTRHTHRVGFILVTTNNAAYNNIVRTRGGSPLQRNKPTNVKHIRCSLNINVACPHPRMQHTPMFNTGLTTRYRGNIHWLTRARLVLRCRGLPSKSILSWGSKLLHLHMGTRCHFGPDDTFQI